MKKGGLLVASATLLSDRTSEIEKQDSERTLNLECIMSFFAHSCEEKKELAWRKKSVATDLSILLATWPRLPVCRGGHAHT